MIDFDKSQWNLSGDLTIEKIPTIIDLIKKQKTDKKTTIDFSKVTSIDTSTLSLIFELQREAKKKSITFYFQEFTKEFKQSC